MIKRIWNRIMNIYQNKIKHSLRFWSGLGVIFLLVLALAIWITTSNEEQVVYKETTVEYGSLSVGVSESGTVDIGTIDQTFNLDINALVRNQTDSSTTGTNSGMSGMNGGMESGGMDMFSQIFSFASSDGSSATATSQSSVEVAQVNVSVGQQVEEGDVLYTLTEDSVAEIADTLESDVEKAKADLEAVYAEQEQSKLSAQHTYDSSVAYGSYASTEYNAAIATLQETVENKQKSLDLAKEELTLYQSRLETAKADYEEASSMYDRMVWGVNNVDKYTSTYLYVQYETEKSSAESNLSTLERQVEELESNIEKTESNIDTYETELAKAKRDLAAGLLSAKKTYDLRLLAYDTAQETYDIALGYLEEDATEQEQAYQDAQNRWEEFSSNITDNTVVAKQSGVITNVYLEVGDTIGTNDTVVTLYDLDEVTMTVTVDEDDMADIAEGTQTNVVFTAYPEDVFRATVSEISDATTSSSGTVTYDVTATLEGDVSDLYQGMTGELTFITKETSEVLYVSNRAIIRSGNTSYVKVKSENGTVKTVEVTTGFSDGVNVEIAEGLLEGDVVLIESKVSE